jgi:formate/nitrite transporter FocA (FNT family)
MFSFRRDKMGFFAGLILMIIAGGTLITTLVLIIVGLAYGDWQYFSTTQKWVLGSAWVACIATVLVRVYVFRYQLHKAEQEAARREEQAEEQSPKPQF